MILPKAYTPSVEPAFILTPEKPSRLVWLILALALALRVWGTWFGYPYVLHPDEHFLAQKALDMFKSPAYDLNPHFFDYPSLYIYVTALVYLILGLVLQAAGLLENLSQLPEYAAHNLFYFHLCGRILCALFGTATIYLTYLVGRRLYGTAAACLAAWFLTIAYVHFTDSHFLATDVPSAFFVMLAFYLSIVALQAQQQKFFGWGGFVAGLAASTKYPVGLILLTVLAAAYLHKHASGERPRLAIFSRTAFMISLCAAAGFLLGTPYALLDFKEFAKGLMMQIHHSKAGHLGIAESGFFGYFTAVVPSGGIGTMLVAAVFAGILFSMLKPDWRAWLLFSFPFFFYLLLGKSALKVDRYLIPAIAFFCIYAGLFIMRVRALLARWPLPQRLMPFALVLIFSAPSLYYAGKWCWIANQSDTRVQAAEWMEAHIPKETSIAIRAGSWMLPPVPPDHFNITQMDLLTEESTKKHLSLKLALLRHPVSASILRHVLNREIEPSVQDSLQAVLNSMPDFVTWRARPLAYYREQNVHFVITSSLLKKRFFDAATVARYPEMAKSWQDFYRELEKDGELVKEFVPPGSYKHKWGMGFLESPTIRIYDIRDSITGAQEKTRNSDTN